MTSDQSTSMTASDSSSDNDAGQLLPPLASERTHLEGLVHREPKTVYESLANLDWDFSTALTTELTHAINNYPAKFIPQLPRRLILALSEPGDLVLDPFAGGGTAGVEALQLGRGFLGLDANPVGVLLGHVKTTSLRAKDYRQLGQLIEKLTSEEINKDPDALQWAPEIPNVQKWYAPAIIDVLASLRALIESSTSGPARRFALAAFVNVAAQASFQESETRYVSQPRPIDPAEPVKRLNLELVRMLEGVRQLEAMPTDVRTEFRMGDARHRAAYGIDDETVGLVVTSPPYPNAYDYHLYHRFRIFWLGEDPADLRRVEIGSHLKHQNEDDPVASYEDDLRATLQSLYSLVVPGRYCAFVVGDGIYKGRTYPTADRLATLASQQGWLPLPPISRSLPEYRRSVTAAGRRLKVEQIVLLQKPVGPTRLLLRAPEYKRFDYEDVLARREATHLSGCELDDHDALELLSTKYSTAIRGLSRAAFWHAVEIEATGYQMATRQFIIEDPPQGRRKNSTYATHGLHRYKGKFYPQLVKALINLSVEPTGDLVVDPFGGSGTVLLEAVLNGINAVSIDCSPLATALAQSKVDVFEVSPATLSKTCMDAVERIQRQSLPKKPDWDQFSEAAHDELESWFPLPVLTKLSILLRQIRSVDDPRIVAFCEILTSDLVREISQQEPRDLRIRRRSEPLTDAPVLALFEERLTDALSRILAVHPGLSVSDAGLGVGRSVLGNSADPEPYEALDTSEQRIDAIVSSPPYATALPYLDTDRLSLAAVFGYDKRARKELENQLIGSRETSKSEQQRVESEIDEDQLRLPESTRRFLKTLLTAVRSDETAGFRRQQLPTVLARYFLGMNSVMEQLVPRLRSNAHVWLVLGDSRTTLNGGKLRVPTTDEVNALAQEHGLESVERIPITVTQENVVHSRHSITKNEILHLRKE